MSNLPAKMKAIVAYAPGDYRFEMVDTPRAGEGEMILKVEGCGICAGDTKAFGEQQASGALMVSQSTSKSQ